MRMVEQMPTVVIKDGERIERANPAIYIYDTSGPYSDESVEIDNNDLIIGQYVSAEIVVNIWESYIKKMIYLISISITISLLLLL